LFGIVVPSITNSVFAPIVSAIEERARNLGYDLLLAHTMNMPEREEASIRRFLSRRVDGLFISPAYRLAPAAPIYEELKRRGMPCVILGPCATFCNQFPNVEGDDLIGSQAATAHLIELGHRRIAYFGGPLSSPAARDRLEGYRHALREAQIEPNDQLIFNAGSTIEDGKKTALELLNESLQITAVQAVNDFVAIGAATIFLNEGIQIPQQLSVVGFGNILTSEFFRVPLTTVGEPKQRLGEAAVDCMLRLLERKTPDSRRLPANLIIRKSSSAAQILHSAGKQTVQKTEPRIAL
jgi:DNA-binding LacI/PurR family transcriptional regulator